MSQDTVLMESIKAVILVPSRDFGRCPLGSRLNRALWPVFGKPALQRLIEQLHGQGIRFISICCENQVREIKSSIDLSEMGQVQFLEEPFPRGTGGCVRDVIEPAKDKYIIVLPACMITLPNVRKMVVLHRQSNAELTVFGEFRDESVFAEGLSPIYICEPTIIDHIPEKGYFDIKEGLIPALVKAGKTVYGADMIAPHDYYRNWREYTFALKKLLIDETLFRGYSCWNNNPNVFVGTNVQISKTARIFGPVIIGDNSRIADKTIVFGPSIIGRNISIGSQSVVEETVLWDDSAIGTQCRVWDSLIDYSRAVPSHTVVSSQLKPTPGTLLQKVKNGFHCRSIRAVVKRQLAIDKDSNKIPVTLSDIFYETSGKIIGYALVILCLFSLILSYWDPTLKDLLHIWMRSDEYSSGMLVPFLALYILWLRRRSFLECEISPSIWGLAALIAAQLFRYFGLYYMYASAERLSFILSIGAVVLFLFGWKISKKFIPVFLFMFLMLPSPKRIETFLATPLQVWATVSSVFCLESLGFSVFREGNVININGRLVAVAEACNGLRMLTAFMVVSGLVALTTNRKWPEKLIILLSSIPIALACNTLRLTITAIAFTRLDTERWEKTFHDFGGFAMMPVAVLIIVLELRLFSHIVIEQKHKQKEIVCPAKILSIKS